MERWLATPSEPRRFNGEPDLLLLVSEMLPTRLSEPRLLATPGTLSIALSSGVQRRQQPGCRADSNVTAKKSPCEFCSKARVFPDIVIWPCASQLTLSQASNQALLGWRKSQVKSFVNIKNIHTAQSLDRPSWGHWPIVPSFQRRRAHIPSEEELRALIKFHKQFPIYVW